MSQKKRKIPDWILAMTCEEAVAFARSSAIVPPDVYSYLMDRCKEYERKRNEDKGQGKGTEKG